jgi:hypothetical protein
MATTRTSDIYIWLYGTPVFSLSYSEKLPETTDTLANFTDISGYRPDPRVSLERGKKYKVTGKFNRETNYNGEDIWILRTIVIDGIARFAYIR